jgi:hypothetical protein
MPHNSGFGKKWQNLSAKILKICNFVRLRQWLVSFLRIGFKIIKKLQTQWIFNK